MLTKNPGDLDTSTLPPPSVEEQQLSKRLASLIRQEMSKGTMPFSRFMELALFTPGLGYYSAGKTKFGEAGDFITAPEMGDVFAWCLARQCCQILKSLDRGDILEAGPGSGNLAAKLLIELEHLGQLPEHYFLLELSADLRQRQRETIELCAPHLLDRVRWIDRLPTDNFRGVILANELLDVMPATLFRITQQGIVECGIAVEDDEFVWRDIPASHELTRRVETLRLDNGYISEINFLAEAWIRTVSSQVETGVVLLIDYGFPAHEYYHPQRHMGTLMCHYHHRAHGNPLILVGLQDITAHIDFTAMATAAVDSGFDILGYTTQAAFLMANGLEELMIKSNPDDTRAHLELTNQIKKLTLPSEMGELFKVMALGKNIDLELDGFRLQDRRGRL
ncbi:MAG: class I SAM-dependent methyltransferase [Acidiferrobacterales bacterium]